MVKKRVKQFPPAIGDDDPLSMYIGAASKIRKMPQDKASGKLRELHIVSAKEVDVTGCTENDA